MIIGSRLVVAVVAVMVISNSHSGSRGTNLSFKKTHWISDFIFVKIQPDSLKLARFHFLNIWLLSYIFFPDVVGKFIRHFRATFHSTHSNDSLIIAIKEKVEYKFHASLRQTPLRYFLTKPP